MGDQPWGRLSRPAKAAIAQAETILVSPASFFEISQKVSFGRWPEMAPSLDRLPAILREQNATVASLTPEIALAAGRMRWDHRDPFDRILAATTQALAVPIVSADVVFDGIVARIW